MRFWVGGRSPPSSTRRHIEPLDPDVVELQAGAGFAVIDPRHPQSGVVDDRSADRDFAIDERRDGQAAARRVRYRYKSDRGW